MGMKAKNNAFGNLATGISASDTTITLGSNQGLRFPDLAVDDWGWATLSNISNVLEIVKITAKTGDTFTVLRGQDGTTASAYVAGDRLDMRPVAAAANDKMDATVAEATYAKKAGGNTFTGVQTIEAQHCAVLPLGSISGTKNLDLSKASTFTATVTGPTIITFTGTPPAGKDQTVYFKVKNGGTNVDFQAGTQYPNGTGKPALTAAGKDLLAVWYDAEDSVYVVGAVWRNYK